MIALDSVSKSYARNGGPPVTALSNVSLDIDPGSFVAIVGPSGSGKSTLMNIIGLLDRPTSGRYRLQGRSTEALGADDLARIRNDSIGFVFQSFHLLPRTTARENVELPLLYARDADSSLTAAEVLESVGLSDRIDHYPNELSGGQQQRVAIARALIRNPSLLLADEPTGNLDSTAGREIMNIFRKLNERGRTVLLITHSDEIAGDADRVIRIVDGAIVEDERRDR